MWTVYSIGDSAYLERILTAVAMIVGTGDFHTIVRIGLLVGLLLVLFQALVQGAQRIDFQQVLVAWIMFSGLYGATTTVTIEDAYTGQVRSVANVPFGVAAIGSLVSEVGYGLTDSFEQAFSVPSITRNGFADAMEVIKRVRINSIDRIGLGYSNDPSRAGRFEFEQSWINYIQNCTIQGIKIGAPLSTGSGIMTDSYIVSATNLLDALRYENPNAGTKININGTETPSCATGYAKLRDYTLDGFYRDFLKETLANALGEPKDVAKVEARIGQALSDLGFGYLPTKDYVVTSVLEPMYAKAWAAEHGIDLSMSYAITIEDALRQRAIQWNAEGSMWQRSIRPMITFLEGFVYAVTPFMALVIVMGPFGVRLAGKYLVLLFWIQLWLPTLAITNLYIMLAIQGKLAALAGTGAGLSLSSISGIMNADSYIQEYLATGQMLAASTPVIALMLVTGAAVTATQFASRIQGSDFVDEKKAAPDTVNSVPLIQQQATRQVDMQGGLRQQGADSVLPTFGYSSAAMEQVSREDGQMKQASAAFSEGLQRQLSSGTTSGSRFDSGNYFSDGRNSSFSHADRAALDIGRTVADTYRSELGSKYSQVASAAAEAALGAKGGGGKGGGILSTQGALAANLSEQFEISQTTAQGIENSLRTAMSKGSAADVKLTEATATDYREGNSNYYTSERGLKYDNSLKSSADEVVSRSKSYRDAVSNSRGARVDQQMTTPQVAQRFAEDKDLRRDLRQTVQQLGFGGAVDSFLDSKQGRWLTSKLDGNEQKAYDVASLMMLNGRIGSQNIDPERAQMGRDAANALIYRGFGADFGSFRAPEDYKDVGAKAPAFGVLPEKVAPAVAPAANIALPDARPEGVSQFGGYNSLVDDAHKRHTGEVARAVVQNERKGSEAEMEAMDRTLLQSQRQIHENGGGTVSRAVNSLSETAGMVGDLMNSTPGRIATGKIFGESKSVGDMFNQRLENYKQEGMKNHNLTPAQAEWYAAERFSSDAVTNTFESHLGRYGVSTENMDRKQQLREKVVAEAGTSGRGNAIAELISNAARTGTTADLQQVAKANDIRARHEQLHAPQDGSKSGDGSGERHRPSGSPAGEPLRITVPPQTTGAAPVIAGSSELRGGVGHDTLSNHSDRSRAYLPSSPGTSPGAAREASPVAVGGGVAGVGTSSAVGQADVREGGGADISGSDFGGPGSAGGAWAGTRTGVGAGAGSLPAIDQGGVREGAGVDLGGDRTGLGGGGPASTGDGAGAGSPPAIDQGGVREGVGVDLGGGRTGLGGGGPASTGDGAGAGSPPAIDQGGMREGAGVDLGGGRTGLGGGGPASTGDGAGAGSPPAIDQGGVREGAGVDLGVGRTGLGGGPAPTGEGAGAGALPAIDQDGARAGGNKDEWHVGDQRGIPEATMNAEQSLRGTGGRPPLDASIVTESRSAQAELNMRDPTQR